MYIYIYIYIGQTPLAENVETRWVAVDGQGFAEGKGHIYIYIYTYIHT